MLHITKNLLVTLMGVTVGIGKGNNYGYRSIGSDDGGLCFILFWLGWGLGFWWHSGNKSRFSGNYGGMAMMAMMAYTDGEYLQ